MYKSTLLLQVRANFQSVHIETYCAFTGEALAGVLGFFGGIHFDDGDHAAFVTAMVYNPSLKGEWINGLFHLLDFGVFAAPDPKSTMFFSGLHHHAGTTPTPAPGQILNGTDYRFTVVCYPSHGILSGNASTAFAPLPGHGVVHIPPEIQKRESKWYEYLKCAYFS